MQKQFRGCETLRVDDKDIKLEYYLMEEVKNNYEDKLPRVSYGIEIVKNSKEKVEIKDVTVNENKALYIIDCLIENNVFPNHLHDVIENFL